MDAMSTTKKDLKLKKEKLVGERKDWPWFLMCNDNRTTAGERIANFIFEELSRSSFTLKYNGKLESFSSLFQLAKLRLVVLMTSKEFHLLLPSDQGWRLKNYFKLLNQQKEKTLILHLMPPDDPEETPKWEQVTVSQPESKKAKMSGSSSPMSESTLITCQSLDISWNALDLAKAAKLLTSTSPNYRPTFADEEEMRRVFALLYDVFRYKYILSEALRETGFLQKYSKHQKDITLVWLLFYDLHKRRFLPRAHADAMLSEEAFEEVGLMEIEKDLWTSRIKLAASLARLRIKNNALRLNQLLPSHLRDERFVSVDETPVTGWINTFKKSKKEICDSIEKLGLRMQSKHETVLTKSDFRFDHLCPKLLLCHPIQRTELAQSPLIREHTIILQDRAFCIGPALMGKTLTEIPLRGTIAQTHVNTPRTTAYFANVLSENDRLEKLVAFGAGDRLLEYQTYIHELGINNCEIYAQRFADLHPEAAVLENLVAVLATPPNSYTGVTDPVNLICSRGGDMNMLKGLTQLELGGDSLGYLDEQRETLKYCMSLPQVQIILYETHSLAPEENVEMVNSVIDAVNSMAREKHEEEHKMVIEKDEAEEKMNKSMFKPGKLTAIRDKTEIEFREQKENIHDKKELGPSRGVEIPPCDLFEVVSLPDLCSHGPNCFSDEGCYFAKIQRKEIISLDAKYMIKIAEARGLFGAELNKKRVPAVRVSKRQERRRTSSAKIKIRKVKLEIDRLAAPTQSTIYRTKRRRESSPYNWASPSCPRHQSHALETMNKGDAQYLSERSMDRRNSRSRRSQDESVRRLSKPLMRRSTSPDNFSSEIKARFWRYATAKSVEDLIRALKKKRRGKRIFKLEDYFFFKEEEIYISQTQRRSFFSNTGILYSKESDQPSLETSITPRKSIATTENFAPDIEIIKPYTNADVLRITSYGAVSDRSSSPQVTPSFGSAANLINNHKKFGAIQQCLDNASSIFNKIDEVVEENKKITGKKIKKICPEIKSGIFNPKRKFKNKNFSPLEALSKIEEISNIIDIKVPQKTDIVLPSKYLPGQQASVKDKIFVKSLRTKLEKLQQSYVQTWTKEQETLSAERLSFPKRLRRKIVA